MSTESDAPLRGVFRLRSLLTGLKRRKTRTLVRLRIATNPETSQRGWNDVVDGVVVKGQRGGSEAKQKLAEKGRAIFLARSKHRLA